MTDPTPSCCSEMAQVSGLSRRGLLRGGLALAGASTVFGSTLVTSAPAAAAAGSDGSVLVVLSLRGAADGMSLVVPHGDPVYYEARPRIAVPADQLLRKDGFFGFHPVLAPLMPLWDSGRMAVVHATGLPTPNRSHFAAMEEVEDANPGSSVREGWLNRLVGELPGTSPLQGFHMGSGVVPTSLYGDEPVFAADEVDRVGLAGADQWDPTGARPQALRTAWRGAGGHLGRGMEATFDAIADFEPARQTPHPGANYPDTELGQALAEVSRVVRGGVGAGVITVDHGDWDMHADLGTLEWGDMRRNAARLADAVGAFFTDLGETWGSKVTMVVLSEFGRRLVENANRGLDHGHGNTMLVLGAGVRGGQHYGTWPELRVGSDADLLVTTDYRQVLAEVVTRRFSGASLPGVFPGLSYAPVGFMSQ